MGALGRSFLLVIERLAAGRGRALWAAGWKKRAEISDGKRDASVAEVARDSFVNVGGMKQAAVPWRSATREIASGSGGPSAAKLRSKLALMIGRTA